MNVSENSVESLNRESLNRNTSNDQHATDSTSTLPNSARIYLSGTLHPQIRVPFREITLSSTKALNGEIKVNEPVRVYDTSGPWGDPNQCCDVAKGLPPLRQEWILGRGDVEEYAGRDVQPRDNGYLTQGHAQYASRRETKGRLEPFPGLRRKPLRARNGANVTQLHYARRGIITPEMEFIAIRENLGRQTAFQPEYKSGLRNNGAI